MVNKIREARRAAGMTQVQLARLAGVSQPKLSEYERGLTVPRPETRARILAALRPRPSVVLEREADRVIELAPRFKLRNVRVFGSSVWGTDTAESDIDLLVTPEDDTSLFDLIGFERAVSELTGYPVDVITDRDAEGPVMERILAESVPL